MAGADKISLNSNVKTKSYFRRRKIIWEPMYCCSNRCQKGWWRLECLYYGGRIDTSLDALDWARKAEKLGAGEILLTSMDMMVLKADLT